MAKFRKAAGYRSRDAFAEKLGVNRYTYRAWESGKAMMNLEQAYNCAVALGCTIDEIAGRENPALSAEESQLVDCYRRTDESDRPILLGTASAMAVAGEAKKESPDPAPHLAKE